MIDETRAIMSVLEGEHGYGAGARGGNWFAMWVPCVLFPVVAGLAEGYARGWDDLRLTPFLAAFSTIGIVATAIWVRAFNRTTYRVDKGAIQCNAPWPRKSWKIIREEIESLNVEVSAHGHWLLNAQVRGQGLRKVPLPESMRKALEDAG